MNVELDTIRKKEGDRFEFEAFGLNCMIRRNIHIGNWCGYVEIPKKSILHGKDYNVFGKGNESLEDAIDSISVHGGLTWSGELNGEGDRYWFGFDCAHAGDAVFYDAPASFPGDVYRDRDYVVNETTSLAKQIRDILDAYDPGWEKK